MSKEERSILFEQLLKEKNKTKKLKEELIANKKTENTENTENTDNKLSLELCKDKEIPLLLNKKRESNLEVCKDKEILEDLKNISQTKKMNKCK